MSVSIKSEHEIELMRHAGHLLEKVHDELASHIKYRESAQKNWTVSVRI